MKKMNPLLLLCVYLRVINSELMVYDLHIRYSC